MRHFLRQLKERHVVKVGVAYLVVAWLMLQVVDVAFPALGLPGWTITLALGLLAAGFPVALVLSWLFDLTPEGVERTVTAGPAASDAPLSVAGPAPANSVAVLPFPDLSAEQDQAHFCDGLTEELLNALAKVSDLRVASRTSSFSFRGGTGDVKAAARKLGVAHILEGSVRKAGNRLRISAQLVEAASDSYLWSETWDRELEDIFSIQEDIAGRILEALQLRLGTGKLVQPTTDNPRAYEYFLRGRGLAITHGETDMDKAARLFEKATQLDPDFTRAWIELAEVSALAALFLNDKAHWRSVAEKAGAQAVRLAPERAESHLARGLSHAALAAFDAAAQDFRRALELDPGLARAHHHLARVRLHQGRVEEATWHFLEAVEHDPDDYVSPLLVVPLLNSLGQHETARRMARIGIERAERTLEDYPDNQRAYYLGAGALLDIDQRERAFEWADRALAMSPDDVPTRYNLGCFYVKAGEPERALDLLEHSITSRSWLENDPDLVPLHGHPRFRALVERLNG